MYTLKIKKFNAINTPIQIRAHHTADDNRSKLTHVFPFQLIYSSGGSQLSFQVVLRKSLSCIVTVVHC